MKKIIMIGLLCCIWGIPELLAQDPRRPRPRPADQIENARRGRTAPNQRRNPQKKGPLHQQIEGIVVDALTGKPISKVQITLQDSTYKKQAFTDKKGRFKIDKVPIGRKELSAQKMGFFTRYISDLQVKGGQQVHLELNIEPYRLKKDSSGKIVHIDSVLIMGQRLRQADDPGTHALSIDERSALCSDLV